MNSQKTDRKQLAEFKKIARELECDGDEKAFDDKLRQIAKPSVAENEKLETDT